MTIKGKLTSVILFLLCFTAFQSLSAQDTDFKDPKFGFGVSLFNFTEYTSTHYEAASLVYMTMNMGTRFRLEPVFGFIFADGFEDYTIGVGGFGRKSISKFNFLYGLRLGLMTNDTEYLAPSLGGEYYFIKNFSIGSEIQLRGIFHEGNFVAYTNSNVIIRFYF